MESYDHERPKKIDDEEALEAIKNLTENELAKMIRQDNLESV